MPVTVQPKFISGDMTTDQELADAIAIMASQMDYAATLKDPFGRLITANVNQLESFDHRNSKQSKKFDETIAGSATSVLNANTSSLDLTTTTGSTDSVIRQSYRQIEYTRGNGQLCLFSLNPGGAPKTNNNRLWGMGDVNNGAFFCIDGTVLKVCVRTKTSGTVVDNEIAQSSWNKDKLDGTGVSGVTLDTSKQNLFFITYSWLGTNIVRFGVVVDGQIIIAHQYNTANTITVPWCQSGSLPFYYRNFNSGTTASNTIMQITCGAALTLGSSERLRQFTTVSTATTPVNLTTAESVIAGVRLRTDNRYIGALPINYQILPVSGNANAYYKVILRPTLTGATWTNKSDFLDALTGTPPTYTGGIIVDEGFVNLTTAGRIAQNFVPNLDTILGYNIAGTPDALIIVMQTTSGTGSVLFAGTIGEIV
jgi:hypothetical protein